MDRTTRWVRIVSALAVLVAAALVPAVASWAAGEWSAPLNLAPGTADVDRACVAVDTAGRVHVVWSEAGEIWHRYHAGQGWSAAVLVGSGIAPSLAAGTAGRVHLAFADRFDTVDDVYCRSWSAPSGWGVAMNVSESQVGAYSPRIAVAPDGSLGVVWNELAGGAPRVYLGRSNDGSAWATAPVPNGQGSQPVLAFVSPSEWWVAWQDPLEEGAPQDVLVTHYAGGEWELPEDVSGTTAPSLWPALAVLQGRPWVAWQEGAAGSGGIYVTTHNGAAWSAPGKQSGAGNASAPRWTADAANRLHLVWTTDNGVQERSVSAGGWAPSEDVATSQPQAGGACIAAATDRLHVTWLAATASSNLSVFYSSRVLSTPTATPTATCTSGATPTPTATGVPGSAHWVYLPIIKRGG